MGTTLCKRSALLAAAAMAWVLGCNDRPPTAPTPTAPTTPTATTTLVDLEIVGPRSVAPGEAVQYAVTGHYSDGSRKDLTPEARRQSQLSAVLSVDAGGRATGGQRGETILSASVPARGVATEVMVLPTGTFRLSVLVAEAGGGRVGAVTVEAEDSRGDKRSDVSPTWDGRYDLYGFAGDTTLRVWGAGYQTYMQRLRVSEHTLLSVDLPLVRPRLDLSGRHTLAITADPGCRDALPEHVKTRRYGADVKQVGPDIRVTLDGADFHTNGTQGNSFEGTMDVFSANAFLSFRGFNSYYYGFVHPDVIERLGDSTYLVFVGTAVTTVSPTRLAGAFGGAIVVVDARWNAVAECRSDRHSFALSR